MTDWIETEHIPVTGVLTSEPSLEEIYLALSHETAPLPKAEAASALPLSKET